ncbi:predicted Rossmann fold nucleotide-binding protein [Olavius algarvensis associated proteobacterium Delta 3]|nr:predicted Rossmann fold nucleotide-binding protein [Olavius algarvensis associated proteobacterium Delta 3]
MKENIIIGVMGGGQVAETDRGWAFRLGQLIAQHGWVLLNGGRNCGIMDASAKGAKSAGGLTIGILPDDNTAGVSDYIDIPIPTGMGSARNAINVLSSDIVVACSGGAGTVSEIALALKAGKTVVLLNMDPGSVWEAYRQKGLLVDARDPEHAIELIRVRLGV